METKKIVMLGAGVLGVVILGVVAKGYITGRPMFANVSIDLGGNADKVIKEDTNETPKTIETTKETAIASTREVNNTTKVNEVQKGLYESYASEKLSLARDGKVVLFFHASWCPSCRGLNSSIENSLGSIPDGVTILKTDYDRETELKQKYGVTYQHTLVQVDQFGNMIKKWSGGSSLDSVLSQIQ